MKILILRFSSIGDIVLTTPVIRALRTQLDEPEIHFATKSDYHQILHENPYLDKIHVLEESESALIKELKKERFDWIIDLHHNLRTRLIKWKLGVPSKSFNKLNLEKWLFVKFKINRLPNRHIVDRYIDTVSHLGVKADSSGLDYFIPDKDKVEPDWLPVPHRKGYYAVVLSATYRTKQLPYQRLIELCDRINNPVVLIGGKHEIDLGDQIEQFFSGSKGQHLEVDIREKLNKKTRIFNACGKFNLNQSASLIKQSQAVFTHDTGMMHSAAAFRKKVYSIWGNTTPHFGMYPYKSQFVIMENNKLSCRPCSKLGFDKCPKGHFKCMNELIFDFYLPEK